MTVRQLYKILSKAMSDGREDYNVILNCYDYKSYNHYFDTKDIDFMRNETKTGYGILIISGNQI